MAEIIATMASVVSLAQLAGMIVKAGVKTRELLRDLDGASEDLTSRLEQLDLIAQGLQYSGDPSVPSPQLLVLQQACLQCHQCLIELQNTLQGIVDGIPVKYGVRRKLALTKVALKESRLEKMERRLSQVVQMLLFSQQVYITWVVLPKSFAAYTEALTAPCYSLRGKTSPLPWQPPWSRITDPSRTKAIKSTLRY